MNHIIKISFSLTDDEYKFLKTLAKKDEVTTHEEMKLLARLQLREEMELEEARERGEQ